MPSSKTTDPAAAPKAPLKPEDVLLLFAKNLKTIREWYRSAPGRGIEVGHHMVGEIAAGDTLSALEAALAGRTWEPPKPHGR